MSKQPKPASPPQAGDQHPPPKQPSQDSGTTRQPQAGTPIFNDWASI